MNVVLRTPAMTREQFLDWVERQDAPFEFDGYEPVAKTGGTRNHSQLCSNLVYELRRRLEGRSVSILPEAGLATVGNAVRYPDVLVTETSGPGTDRLMPRPIIVFEVVSPTSGRVDRMLKLREYRAVPSIRRYVVIDNLGPDIAVFSRQTDNGNWIADALTADEVLALPEIGVSIPVNDLFRGVSFEGG